MDMPRQVAYLVNQYPMVSHSFIRREIQALERQGFQIQRVALRGWDAKLVDDDDVLERSRTQYILQNGFIAILGAVARVFVRSPYRFLSSMLLAVRVGWGAQRALPYHLSYLAEACRVLRLMEISGAKHLHAHFGTNSAEIAMLVRALGGPTYSFTVHGQDDLLFGGLREKIDRAGFVVAVSSFGRGLLWRRIPCRDWPKINVVHCGLEREFFAMQCGPFPRAARFVCVGRLSAEKGQSILVNAAALLVRRGLDFDLVLAGDGPMRRELEDLVEHYELRGRVRITGWLSSAEVREQILCSQALVLPSFSEGLPVVIMEAMALCRPVIATYVGGIPELVKVNEHGWLVPAGSIEDLADAMADCLATPHERLIEMGKNARHRVIERHSIETEAAKLARLFDRDDIA